MTVLSPYAVCLPALWHRLGSEVRASALRFDPLRVESAEFVAALHRFDRLVYDSRQLAFPRWGLFDCAMVPGLVCGFAQRASDCGPEVRDALRTRPEDVWLPVSLFIAVPLLEPDAWLGHSIACVSQGLAGQPDLRARTVELALALLRPHTIVGTTQWRSSTFEVLAHWAPLEILSAWVEPHEQPGTLVYRFRPGRARAAVGGTEFVDVDCSDELIALQARLERGERLVIAAPPFAREQRRYMPIAAVRA